MIIANYIEKIKQLAQKSIYFLAKKDTLVSLIILSTGVASFVLGYHAGKDSEISSPKVIFTEPRLGSAPAAAALAVGGDAQETLTQDAGSREKSTIFGSKSGTKYYYSWCKSGNRVKLENRIYFESKERAEAAGRTIAANCK